MSFFMAVPTLGVDCENFVEKKAKGELVVVTAQPIPYLQFAQQTVYDSPVGRLVTSGLLHSNFFSEIVTATFNDRTGYQVKREQIKDTAKQIRLLSPIERENLAQKVYDRMKQEFDNKSEIVAKLEDPLEAREVLFGLPESVVVDKISEALLFTGRRGGFRYPGQLGLFPFSKHGEGIASLSAMVSIPALVISGIPAAFEGLTYYSAAGLSIGAVSSYLAYLGFFRPAKINRYFEFYSTIKMHGGNNTRLSPLEVSSIRLRGGGNELKRNLGRIEQQAITLLERVPGQEISPQTLPVFATRTLGLHREFHETFTTDFMSWMAIYAAHRFDIKDKLEAIRLGQLNPEDRKSTLSFLEGVFIEANEATNNTRRVTQKIITLLKDELEFLDAWTPSEGDFSAQRDYARKSRDLRDAIEIQEQFRDYLDNVQSTISIILGSVDGLNNAISAALVRMVGHEVIVRSQQDVIEVTEALESMDIIVDRIQWPTKREMIE